MRHGFAWVLVLAAAAGVGCAAREPIMIPPPTAEPRAQSTPPRSIEVAPPSGETLPKFGDYVYVEVLPEVTTKVGPQYPTLARESGVDGTVIVQALVGRDGTVLDTRIVKSIPMLDAAAAAAVMQWVFKPAQAHGEPVAVWVAAPVKFALH